MTPNRQLVFDLPTRAAAGRDDFFVADANRVALAQVEDWANWPLGKLVLSGDAGSGKSHLASVFAELTGGQVIAARDAGADTPAMPLAIDDVPDIAGDRAAEQRLFHLHERVIAAGWPMLFIGRGGPGSWNIGLQDLSSRLMAAGHGRIMPPDDALLNVVIVKHFHDRQLNVSPAIVTYLAQRIDRSLADVETIVARLDQAALSVKRPISKALLARILEQT